jgi:hypothetical protein
MRFRLILVFMFVSLVPLVAEHSFEITFPENEDAIVAYEDLAKTNLTFTGTISGDGSSIRVLWAAGDASVISTYLDKGRKAIPGKRIDDYVLGKFKAGDTDFIYRVAESLSNLAFGSNFYRFIATFSDGTKITRDLVIYVIHGHYGEKAKPVIYLYPQNKTRLRVVVRPRLGLSVSDPPMGDAWDVVADPDGRIVDSRTGSAWPYLFWESPDEKIPIDITSGFVVSRADLLAFLDEKLSFLGLSKKEISDFSAYWLPQLSEKPWVFLTFYDRERIDREAPLEIIPKPDSVIRVYFDHLLLDAPIKTSPQELVPGMRKGFCAVEWGGRRY